MTIFASSSRGTDSRRQPVASAVVAEMQREHPDAHANDIVEARRALVAELERRRRAAAAA